MLVTVLTLSMLCFRSIVGRTVLELGTEDSHLNHSSVPFKARDGASTTLVWPEGGPSIDQVIDWQAELPPEVAISLYAISKCNHRWVGDLLARESMPGYRSWGPTVSMYDEKTYQRNLITGSFREINPERAAWPKAYVNALSSLKAYDPTNILGSGTMEYQDYLRLFTGMPVSRWTAAQYSPAQLKFAIDRSNESPVLFETSDNASVLQKKTLYAVANPDHGPDKTIQVWTPGAEGSRYNPQNVTLAQLQADLSSLSSITDFKRWTPSAFLPCNWLNNQLVC
ncbi:hypothetical protein BD324DRAFT_652777 [Kockovaella imperatae]|uniref:Uncharacterized protein n=1 Tax=Kockovaella imperatae TaxID=4999 RepID=A0A1Y1UAJ8_9TREE|nr:hypothetical protein BD324DRAFT_652777 [Kockovaella imperatae]ORX35060.1 hypothetical protein BD324DRAFT_652777 [Kockovaella imperatae]